MSMGYISLKCCLLRSFKTVQTLLLLLMNIDFRVSGAEPLATKHPITPETARHLLYCGHWDNATQRGRASPCQQVQTKLFVLFIVVILRLKIIVIQGVIHNFRCGMGGGEILKVTCYSWWKAGPYFYAWYWFYIIEMTFWTRRIRNI